MLSDTDMLNNIRKGTQMGCHGIDKMLPKTRSNEMKQDLLQQKREYNEIYSEADRLLTKQGGEKQNLSMATKMMSSVMSDMQTMMNSSTTKLAEMMITGNTMGVTKSIRHLNGYKGSNEQVLGIANKLLETEQRNIVQMQQYL